MAPVMKEFLTMTFASRAKVTKRLQVPSYYALRAQQL